MNDVLLAKLRRIKLPHHHETGGARAQEKTAQDGYSAQIYEAGGVYVPGPIAKLGKRSRSERYVFTRSVKHGPSKATMHALMLVGDRKAYVDSLKVKYGFHDLLLEHDPVLAPMARTKTLSLPSLKVSPNIRPTGNQAGEGANVKGGVRQHTGTHHTHAHVHSVTRHAQHTSAVHPQGQPVVRNRNDGMQQKRPSSPAPYVSVLPRNSPSPSSGHRAESPHDGAFGVHDTTKLLATLPRKEEEGFPAAAHTQRLYVDHARMCEMVESMACVGIEGGEVEEPRMPSSSAVIGGRKENRTTTFKSPRQQATAVMLNTAVLQLTTADPAKTAAAKTWTMCHFAEVLATLYRKGELRCSWQKWGVYVHTKSNLDFTRGLKHIMREEAVVLFVRTYRKLRKMHLTHAIRVWKKATAHLRHVHIARQRSDAQVVIFRNVVKWNTAKKERRKAKAIARAAAKRRRMMRQVLAFEEDGHSMRSIHRWNKERAKQEGKAATVIQKHIRRHIAVKTVESRRQSKQQAEASYSEWFWQMRAAAKIQRSYHHARGWGEFKRRVGIRVERRLYQEMLNRSASVIQEAWRKYLERQKAMILVIALRFERQRNQASSVIGRSWRNYHHIRTPINKRAEARRKHNLMIRRHNTARVIQDCWIKHHNYFEYLRRRTRERERKEAIPGAATTIACAYRAALLRRECARVKRGRLHVCRYGINMFRICRLRGQVKRKRHIAATRIQMWWCQCKADRDALERLREQQRREEEELRRKEEVRRLQNASARKLQVAYRRSVFRYNIHRRAFLRWERMRHLNVAAAVIQRSYRQFKANRGLHMRYLEKQRWLQEIRRNNAAIIIQRSYSAHHRRYYAPGRVVIRRQMEVKVKQAELQRLKGAKEQAARRVQLAWKQHMAWRALKRRFQFQKDRMTKQREDSLRNEKARRIQIAWRTLERVMAQRRHRRRRVAAKTIQRAWRSHRDFKILQLRFMLRHKALVVQAELELRKREAEEEESRALVARKEAEEELAYKITKSWKLGADGYGRNYYYNYITGDSTWEKPEGWEPLPEETWIKNTDARGNVYYYHILTGESRWLPPCSVCYGEAARYCVDCDLTFCVDHYEDAHEAEEMKKHTWKGADTEKDTLEAGEVFCIECKQKAAKRLCKVCRDAYCHRCFEETHRAGALAKHPYIPYSEAKKGWQVVPGKTPQEPPFYFNATTGESTYEKPKELMSEEELAEHEKFVKAKAAAERYVKKIDELQTQVEELNYKADLKWAEEMQRQKEMEELKEQLAELQRLHQNFWEVFKDHVLPWRAYKKRKMQKAQDMLEYRKKLLVTRRDRKGQGMVLGEELQTDAKKQADGSKAAPVTTLAVRK